MTNDDAIYTKIQDFHVSSLKLWWRRFFIRLKSWEYWPMYVFNIPILFVWLWNALRSRDLFFFTLTNPGIPTGGFFGESKSNILDHIPEEYKPRTYLLKPPVSETELTRQFEQSRLQYPIIAKPEVGERGWHVSKINNFQELEQYVKEHPIDLLLQTYIDFPLEVCIMVYAMPDGTKAEVTSICEKYFLQIKGDGIATLGHLILQQDRAVLQLEKLIKRFGHRWNEVIQKNEVLVLEHVGNHSRGTTFLNRNDRIGPAITRVMLMLLKTMPEVFYGRFDMRVPSWQDLEKGKNIRVMEFNGASSDPGHIYQPGYSLFRAYRDMAFHWGVMRKIASQNRKRGYARARIKKIISALIIYFRYKRTN
ncbi:MAG TPA: hypothetical protein VFV79_00400 [Saprospiraceae bacterium]|nr:hypothetical protein [Saprospiraceae bacterium]